MDTKDITQSTLLVVKDKFFSMISHDLRNPFNTVLMLSEILAEHSDAYNQQQIKKYAGRLRDAANTFSGLLTNLLDWSLFQRGGMTYTPCQFDLQEVASRNATLLASIAAEKQISLENLIQETTPVYGDEKMIDTVVRNLLSNALKFTNTEGHVEISAALKDDMIEVAVSDTGIGIDQQHIAKLFRIETTHKQIGTAGEQGTGLGLILCKDFVEKNGGRIWVESEAGNGSIFKFIVPTYV